MRGRTMYVIPFLMGPHGSAFSKVGIQVTDSVYVVLNMRIMTRMGKSGSRSSRRIPTTLRAACIPKPTSTWSAASSATYPQDNTIWSVGSGYGGNALLGEKSAWRCVSPASSASKKAGSPSIC